MPRRPTRAKMPLTARQKMLRKALAKALRKVVKRRR